MDGIKEKVGESWEDCEAEVEKLFREKLDIEDKIIIERAHRAKKQKTAKKISQGQWSAVCEILKTKRISSKIAESWKAPTYLSVRISPRRHLNTEENSVKRLREEEDKIAYLNYRSIVVRSKNTES